MKNTNPFACFLTFRTYGSWLHGDLRYSVDRVHNTFNSPLISPRKNFQEKMHATLQESEFILNVAQCHTTLKSIINTCHYHEWNLLAAHVRSNHVHIVVQSLIPKEKIVGIIKSYATRLLKHYYHELAERKNFWSRHASTRNIWVPESLFPIMYYVIKAQGEPMALYYDKKYYDMQDEQYYEAYF